MESILNRSGPVAHPPRGGHKLAGSPHLELTGRVDSITVQQAVARTPAFLTDVGTGYVDLSAVTSFDIGGVVLLLALIADRVSSAGRTKFQLPRSDLARHVLRKWEFPAAASVISGVPFRNLVERSDLEYFGE